jgi:hypothetical protein
MEKVRKLVWSLSRIKINIKQNTTNIADQSLVKHFHLPLWAQAIMLHFILAQNQNSWRKL